MGRKSRDAYAHQASTAIFIRPPLPPQFFNRIHPGSQMGNFPYQTHFNEIAKEERSLGYPDVTFMVRGVDGYPHQIEFRDARKGPDTTQLGSLRKGADDIVQLYCPGHSHPY